jgi:hypothetical protein
MARPPSGTRRSDPNHGNEVVPRPPKGWPGKLLLAIPAALFLFILGVLIWGILADLLAGY